MKRILLITYDLKTTSDRKSFQEAIKETCPSWWHYLRNTWLVHTDKTPQELYELLLQHIDQEKGGHFLVAEITSNNQGWLPQKAWNWINSKEAP